MTPEEAFQKLDSVLRSHYPGLSFSPSGICSRVLQVPFKEKSGLSYTLTLFVEVEMAPTTGMATAIEVTLPPRHQWKAGPDQIAEGSEEVRALAKLLNDLGREYLARERKTLKVLNNRDLGEQLARLCQANGDQTAHAGSDRFQMRKNGVELEVQIVESSSALPLAAAEIKVDGVDNKTLMSALRVLLQYNPA